MVSNTVAVDAITFSIFISYWWKIFGNRHIRGESRVCHMHVHITRCIHLHHEFTKIWCITNTLLSANQRILSVADIIAYSFKQCTVCKSVPKELFSSFLQMIEKRALFDYVIFHVNICHILNKFKHNFFYFFVEKYMHSEQCRLYSYTSCCCLFQQPHAERVSRRKTPAETCQFRMKK